MELTVKGPKTNGSSQNPQYDKFISHFYICSDSDTIILTVAEIYESDQLLNENKLRFAFKE